MADATVALNRFGLGARRDETVPGDPSGWLNDQLQRFTAKASPLTDQPSTAALVGTINALRGARRDRKAGDTPEGRAPGTPEPGREMRAIYARAVAARTEAALATPAPFIERLVHFWANHFAVSVDKAVVLPLAGDLEFSAIRPHVLGRFADMLRAVERHPAMLLYLDQARSIGPDSRLGQRATERGRTRGLNENLAREILELHTLGVRSGYDQADVTEFARALTGWTMGGLGGPGPLADAPAGFVFAQGLHQPGPRTIMGQRFADSGERQAQAVLDMLARHPATAHHIATKLARHFAGDNPPPALIARLERAFLDTGGDLPSLYRTLIAAPEVWQAPPKFRSPWDWAIAALRATGISRPAPRVVAVFDDLGQAVWKPGSPAGYADTTATWAAPDAIYRRVELARTIAESAESDNVAARARHLFGTSLSAQTKTVIARAESWQQGLALLLVCPEMMRR